METGAQEIADIYKRRRQVELFFKWIKQNLKIKSFWGSSENAVFSRIWAALIIPVLLWICRTLDGVTASASQILQMIKRLFFAKAPFRDYVRTSRHRPNSFSPSFFWRACYD
jgi:putative transposase